MSGELPPGRFVIYEPKRPPIAPDDPDMVNPSLDLFDRSVQKDSWRCGCCHVMQYGGTLFYVEDTVKIGDSWITIIDRHRRLNRGGTGWCETCARKLLPE